MRYLYLCVSAVALTLFCLFWSGCSTTPEPLMDRVLKQAIDPTQISVPLAVRALTEASYAPSQFASVHIRPMPELPDVEGGLPIVMQPKMLPKTGTEFMVNWLTRPVGAYPSGQLPSWDPANHPGDPEDWPFPSIEVVHPDIRPNLPTALLLTLREPGPPQPIPGGGGGMLQVPPDYVMVPQRVDHLQPWHRPGVPFELVHNDRGQIMLRVTLPEKWAGISVWCQLLCTDTRVPSGCVSTPMVEIHIGNR